MLYAFDRRANINGLRIARSVISSATPDQRLILSLEDFFREKYECIILPSRLVSTLGMSETNNIQNAPKKCI